MILLNFEIHLSHKMFSLEYFISDLCIALEAGLPGEKAQLKMAPKSRAKAMSEFKKGLRPTQSGVLILFYEKNSEIYTVFIKRSSYDGVHSGQISFPGGKYEDSDHSLIKTAIREANEEIGIKYEHINYIGELSELYIPPSNFNVLPVLAYTTQVPDFILDKNEVEKLIEVPISLLCKPEIIHNKPILNRLNKQFNVSCYFIDNEIIWGATAMIVSELIELIKDINLKS